MALTVVDILEDIIRSIHLTSQWKILVVDSPALKILNSACKMADLMDDNVTCKPSCDCHPMIFSD